MPDTPRILIIDDDEQFCRSLRKRLVSRGMAAQYACRGDLALDMLEREPFDVVLLDLKMPGTGGIELLKEIKRRKLPVEVILLSGHAAVETAMEAVELGAYDYLLKPCDLEEILLKISLAFDRLQ